MLWRELQTQGRIADGAMGSVWRAVWPYPIAGLCDAIPRKRWIVVRGGVAKQEVREVARDFDSRRASPDDGDVGRAWITSSGSPRLPRRIAAESLGELRGGLPSSSRIRRQTSAFRLFGRTSVRLPAS